MLGNIAAIGQEIGQDEATWCGWDSQAHMLESLAGRSDIIRASNATGFGLERLQHTAGVVVCDYPLMSFLGPWQHCGMPTRLRPRQELKGFAFARPESSRLPSGCRGG